MNWQPIETAPKDGTFIIAASPSGYTTTAMRAEICGWSKRKQTWINHAGDRFTDGGDLPTHWMPLPEPPKDGESK